MPSTVISAGRSETVSTRVMGEGAGCGVGSESVGGEEGGGSVGVSAKEGWVCVRPSRSQSVVWPPPSSPLEPNQRPVNSTLQAVYKWNIVWPVLPIFDPRYRAEILARDIYAYNVHCTPLWTRPRSLHVAGCTFPLPQLPGSLVHGRPHMQRSAIWTMVQALGPPTYVLTYCRDVTVSFYVKKKKMPGPLYYKNVVLVRMYV